MIEFVVLPMVCFLETYHTIQPMLSQFAVFLGLKWHDLNLYVREIFLCDIDGFRQVRHTGFGRVLTCDEQDILERCEFFDSLVFIFNLLRREYGARHRV